MTKALSTLVLLSFATAASGQGLLLPPSTPSYGQDEFQSSDGTSCRTSMDGSKRVEAGAFGTGAEYRDGRGIPVTTFNREPSSNVGAYVRFSIALDAPRSRMDCRKLYELELEKKRLELDMVKQSLRASEEKIEKLQQQLEVQKQDAPPL